MASVSAKLRHKLEWHSVKCVLMGAHRPWQGGHLPSPGIVEKCYRIKKTSFPKSVWTAAKLLYREERPRMIVQHRLFRFCISYYKRIVCPCTRILKTNEGTPDASPDLGLESQCKLSPDFTIYTDQWGGGKVVAASGHLEVKNCKKSICTNRFSTIEGTRSPLPKNYTPPRPFRPRLTISPPLEKILRAAHVPLSRPLIPQNCYCRTNARKNTQCCVEWSAPPLQIYCHRVSFGPT